ncbi:hypothetical protein NX059_001281 [Plenodomus lindquistii]|nr:hypothetical protein NX059_001281 [Plenodomus lindquistii]
MERTAPVDPPRMFHPLFANPASGPPKLLERTIQPIRPPLWRHVLDFGLRRSRTSEPTEREYTVCGDRQQLDQSPELEACAHAPDVCQECFAGWLRSQLDNTSWDRITCPVKTCRQTITAEEMRTHAPEDVFERYDHLSTRAMLGSIPEFRHCLRAGYDSGQIHDDEDDGNILRCNACGFLACTIHETAFHVGLTCAQYDA